MQSPFLLRCVISDNDVPKVRRSKYVFIAFFVIIINENLIVIVEESHLRSENLSTTIFVSLPFSST